jgi:hypothetical protein
MLLHGHLDCFFRVRQLDHNAYGLRMAQQFPPNRLLFCAATPLHDVAAISARLSPSLLTARYSLTTYFPPSRSHLTHAHPLSSIAVAPARLSTLPPCAPSSSTHALPNWWASTTDALASRRVEELRVTLPSWRVARAAAAAPVSSAPLQAPCTAADLCANIELHNDKPPFVQAVRWHYVESVCFKCFGGMLQVFYIDVAKVDWDVAHVAIVFQGYV